MFEHFNKQEVNINFVVYLNNILKINTYILDENSDITIDQTPYQFKNLNNFQNNDIGLLAYLIKRRFFDSLSTKTQQSACGLADVFVNYIFEHDIHNQVFNSSFQDFNSFVVQNVWAIIADWTSEELYQRNLVSYIPNKANLIRIIDVSQQYNNRPTIRFYVSIDIPKGFIPVVRNVFELVFDKLQQQTFSSTPSNDFNTSNMVVVR